MYGIDFDDLNTHIEVLGLSTRLSHSQYIELTAFVQGEKVTPHIIDSLAGELKEGSDIPDIADSQIGRRIRIVCQDGVLDQDYRAETLERHFLLFRDFFSEFPGEITVLLDKFTTQEVGRVISAVMASIPCKLDDRTLYLLQTLNPVHNGYFLLFDLTGVPSELVTHLISQVSEEEKRGIISFCNYAHARDVEDYGCHYFQLPPGVEILAATSNGLSYLSTEEGHKLVQHKGWAFVQAVKCANYKLANSLIMCDFSQDKFIATTMHDDSTIVEALVKYMMHCDVDTSQHVRVTSMLDLRHPSLEKSPKRICAPYHLVIKRHHLSSYHLPHDLRSCVFDLIERVFGEK